MSVCIYVFVDVTLTSEGIVLLANSWCNIHKNSKVVKCNRSDGAFYIAVQLSQCAELNMVSRCEFMLQYFIHFFCVFAVIASKILSVAAGYHCQHCDARPRPWICTNPAHIYELNVMNWSLHFPFWGVTKSVSCWQKSWTAKGLCLGKIKRRQQTSGFLILMSFASRAQLCSLCQNKTPWPWLPVNK